MKVQRHECEAIMKTECELTRRSDKQWTLTLVDQRAGITVLFCPFCWAKV